MRDYAELITRLKQSDDNCNAECCECSGECLSSGCNIFSEAADAIEELQGKLKELYYLTCDINKNEINAQIEWGNLDNFLRAFRKYADKIAGVELPEPPKEEDT